MKKCKCSAKVCLVFALVFTLVFTALSAGLLRDWGKVSISDVKLETASGSKVAARIYKPDSATAEHPAPAVIFTHGLTVNKESYAQYGMELSRRGFVVIMPDMLNHGDSEIVGAETYFAPYTVSDAYGAYACVRYVKTLDYVDQTQIGVAGHSAGGQASNNMVRLDNAEENPVIAAIYLVSSDPAYKDEEGNWANIYGTRDMGLLYTLYDHVYYRGTNEAGETLGVQEYRTSQEVKSLFAFGQEPDAFEGTEVESGKIYTAEIDGKTVTRRLNQVNEIHPKPQGDTAGLTYVIDFFQDVFTAPNPIASDSNHFFLLSVLNMLGLLGVLMSCVFTLGTLTQLKVFQSVAPGANVELRPAPSTVRGKVGFWVLTIANFVFAFLSISLIFARGFGYCCFTFLPQQPSNIYAFWALLNGAFMLLTSFGSYWLYGKKDGASMEQWGLKISPKDLGKSILVAVCSCCIVFVITFVANRLFKVDYHYYLWGLKNIPWANLLTFFEYLPFYLVFGMAVSIALNSAYHCKIGKEPEWVNDLFFAVMNMLPSLIITFVGFYLYAKNGVKPLIFGSTYTYTYTLNAIPVFPVAVILIRRLFKKCNNPYIPGIVAAILLCWLQVSCSFTIHARVFYGPMAALLP